MTTRFLALDVETAAPQRWSICQIGLVAFERGQEVDSCGLLVHPHCGFSPFNVGIHGIAEQHVAGAPDFPSIFPAFAATMSGQVVVSHTSFDRIALEQACTRYGLIMPECRWLDSACIARRVWPAMEGGYSLPVIARTLGITFRHHDATEDARACGQNITKAMLQTGMRLCDLAEM